MAADYALHAAQDVLARLARGAAGPAPQNQPYLHPLVPEAIIMPRTGPVNIDYSAAGVQCPDDATALFALNC